MAWGLFFQCIRRLCCRPCPPDSLSSLPTAASANLNSPPSSCPNLPPSNRAGTLPTSVATLPSLIVFDASNNSITGDLGPFAMGLTDGSETFMELILANNQLTGDVPNTLANSTILDSNAITFTVG